MNLDQQPKNWQICTNPGGIGIPVNQSITSVSGGLEVSLTGPAYTDALFCEKELPATSATQFESDFWISIPTMSGIQALEYDTGIFNPPTEWMFGTECVIGAKWQIWNGLDGQWVNTAIPCGLTSGTHHIQQWVHRVGKTMYFDELGVDNVYSVIGMSEPAGPEPSGWPGFTVFQVQLDTSNVKGDVMISETLSKANLVELP